MATQFTLLEGAWPAEFLISEAPGTLSRENVTLLLGNNLTAGAVLGQITVSAKYTEYDPAAADGSETPAGILLMQTDATLADLSVAIIDVFAEVKGSLLVWKAGLTTEQKVTAHGLLRSQRWIKVR